MKIYAFSGLGADGRIFSHLHLDHEIVPIKWIEPRENESLESYAIRLGAQIDTSQPYMLLGVSFGGMLVSELSKSLQPKKVILISSAATRKQLPWMASLSRYVKLHRFLPARIYKPPLWASYLSFPLNKAHREVAQGIIRDMDYRFVKWALGAIVDWKNEEVPANMIHIHGWLDPILPLKKRMNAEVQGSGHFIILKNAGEISNRINQLFIE